MSLCCSFLSRFPWLAFRCFRFFLFSAHETCDRLLNEFYNFIIFMFSLLVFSDRSSLKWISNSINIFPCCFLIFPKLIFGKTFTFSTVFCLATVDHVAPTIRKTENSNKFSPTTLFVILKISYGRIFSWRVFLSSWLTRHRKVFLFSALRLCSS